MRWILKMLLLSSLAACIPMDPKGGLPPAFTPTFAIHAATQEGVEVSPPITPDAAADQMVILSRLHLARKLGLTPNEIALFEVRAAEWPDASLGCPQTGLQYAQVLTPGFQILLEAAGKLYTYHTDTHDSVVLCEGRGPGEIYNPP